jgi:hypothetical protein
VDRGLAGGAPVSRWLPADASIPALYLRAQVSGAFPARGEARSDDDTPLEEDPALAAVYEHMLLKSTVYGQMCTGCAGPGGLYVVRNKFVVLCAPCTREKIGQLAGSSCPPPEWVRQLEREARAEIRARKRRLEESLTVTWDDLYRCVRCGRMIRSRDARYPFPHTQQSIPPHCITCYDVLMARSDGGCL